MSAFARHRRSKRVIATFTGFEADLEWATASFAVIDFETTGLDPAVDRVLEMGIVTFDDGVQTGSHNWLIQPTIPVPEEASKVHGITDEMLADQPRFEAVWAEMRAHLEGRLPVAYNAGFDKNRRASLVRMNVSMVVAGYAASSGMKMPPALLMAMRATTCSGHRSIRMPTRSPGFTPRVTSQRARASVSASSWRYV